MCQVNVYLKEEESEKLLHEHITKMEFIDRGVRISTLLEGTTDLADMIVDHIDFSAGKIVLHSNN